MRRSLQTAAFLALFAIITFWTAPAIATAETDWRTLYTNFITLQQAQTRARRAVALIDLEGDGVPEMVQLASVKGGSRNCRLNVYKVQSGAVIRMSSDDFDFNAHLFSGVRSVSFGLRADASKRACLWVQVTGVKKGITTRTRLAFTQSNSSGKLNLRHYDVRDTKGRKARYFVGGEAVSAARYKAAASTFGAAYPKKGSSLPYQMLAATAGASKVKSGASRLFSRYKAHSTVKSIALSKTSLTLAYGAKYTLKAAVSPASAIYDSLAWVSSNPSVVKVEGGVLTALDVGKATITCKAAGGAKKSCTVVVSAPPATSVEITGAARTVVLKQKLKLSAVVSPAKASQTVKWTSTDSSVASVSNGEVTGRKMGTTTIRATTANGKVSSYAVTVLAEPLDKQGKIIDISRWNEVTNWSALQKEVSFVILRCGVTYSANHSRAGEMDIDAKFKTYASKCLAYGIPFGVYYYGMASTAEQGRQEAEKAYEFASKYNPLFYVYDAEEAVLTKASIEAFGARLRELGVKKVGAYIAHHRYSKYKVNTALFDFIWIPHYGTNDGTVNSTPSYACDLHQYTSVGKVNGIRGDVDLNRLMGRKPLSFFTS
jgi:GH25 family lysozyme M1 (1,4-beta-N-acetylmuramidase)